MSAVKESYEKRREDAVVEISGASRGYSIHEQQRRFCVSEGMKWQLENLPPGTPTGHLLGQKDIELLQMTNDYLRNDQEKLRYSELLEFASYVGFNPNLIDDFFRIKGKTIPKREK